MSNLPNDPASPASSDHSIGQHAERQTPNPSPSNWTEAQRPEYTLDRASFFRLSPLPGPSLCSGIWTAELARKRARTLKRQRGTEGGTHADAREEGMTEECQEFYKRVDTALSAVAQMQTDMLRLIANSDDLLRELGAILRNMR